VALQSLERCLECGGPAALVLAGDALCVHCAADEMHGLSWESVALHTRGGVVRLALEEAEEDAIAAVVRAGYRVRADVVLSVLPLSRPASRCVAIRHTAEDGVHLVRRQDITSARHALCGASLGAGVWEVDADEADVCPACVRRKKW
jgi:hypothetical protein